LPPMRNASPLQQRRSRPRRSPPRFRRAAAPHRNPPSIPALKFTISAGTLILAVIYAHIKPLHILQPVFNWLGEGMANFNEILDWALVPVVLIIKVFFKGIFLVLRPIVNLFNPRSVITSQEDPGAFDEEHHKIKKGVDKQ
jgi:hypothetical protein